MACLIAFQLPIFVLKYLVQHIKLLEREKKIISYGNNWAFVDFNGYLALFETVFFFR